MKKILAYGMERLFYPVIKIIFALVVFYVMQSNLFPVEWGIGFEVMLGVTVAFIFIHNVCIEIYKDEKNRGRNGTPFLIIAASFLGIFSGLYFVARIFEDPADDRLRLINFCYYMLIINVLFSFIEPAVEKYKISLYRRKGITAR